MEFTLKRNTKKSIAIITAMAIILTLLMPMGGAFATDNSSDPWSVPKLQDGSGKSMADLVIREDDGDNRFFVDDDQVTINLPSGVEFDVNPTIATLAQYVSLDEPDMTVSLVAAGANFITVKLTGTPDELENELRFYFGDRDTKTSTVDIGDDVTGDIEVEIDAEGTNIKSEFIRLARVVVGDTTTTISDVKTIGLDTSGEISTIRIRENSAGVLEAVYGDLIELELPSDFEWVEGSGGISPSGLGAVIVGLSDDKETLEIRVTSASSGRAGFIALSGWKISVPDDADMGDVEMTIEGNEVAKETVVIAKVKDFGFKLETKGDIPTVIAGKEGQEVAEINIKDEAKGSWIEGRTVTLELPSWAKWSKVDRDDREFDFVKMDDEELRYRVTDKEGDVELKDMEITIDADAPAGDLVVEISGSAGVEGELVIATVLAPFEVTADAPEFVIGVQRQVLGDIVFTEPEDGAIGEGKWIMIKAPRGVEFTSTPDTEVTDGDMKVDDEEIDDQWFAFRVKEESNKEAATIKISDIEVTLDRTVPVGAITFEMYMTKSGDDDYGKNYVDDIVEDDFDEAIDKDNRDQVTTIVVGNVITPVVAREGSSTVFTIGSAIFNVDGVMRAMDVAPYVKDGRTFLPVRFVAQAVGVADDNIDWNAQTRTVTLTEGDTVVELVIGSKTITIDGASEVMDVAPELTAGRTMLPARAVAEAFGFSVGWDAATRAVVISN